ncbi:probable isoaspartyl peptidase/L-asparaginase 3 isoform X1 [Tanacetum coccineum]
MVLAARFHKQLQDAQMYMFDEPSSYLDIKQRLKAAQVIRSLLTPKRSLKYSVLSLVRSLALVGDSGSSKAEAPFGVDFVVLAEASGIHWRATAILPSGSLHQQYYIVNKNGTHAGACYGWTFQYSVRSPGMDDVEVVTVYP